MLRLRVKSSFRALRTPFMSSFTSSRLMIFSTRAVLIFTLADWPFAFAWKKKRGKEGKGGMREDSYVRQIISNQISYIDASSTTEVVHMSTPGSNLPTDLLLSWWHTA